MLRRFSFYAVFVLSVSIVFILAGAYESRADVLFSYGFNARGMAMGGAEAAQAQDFGVAYYNPGAGVMLKQPALGVGYIKTGSWLETRYAAEDDKAELKSTAGSIIGAVLPIPLGGIMEDRIAVQFAGFSPPDIFSDLDVPYPDRPQYPLLRNSGRQATFSPSLSIRVHDAFAFGGGAQLFSNTNGQITAVIDATGDVQTLTGQEVFTSFAPVAGMIFRPGEIWSPMEAWALGLVFREEFFMTYRIPINSYIGTTPLTLTFNATSLYTPRQWVLGVSYADKARKFIAEINGSYNEWRNYPDPNLYVEVNFNIPVIDIVFLNSVRHPPKFHDTFTLRGGVERYMYDSDSFSILTQAGYFYDQSPVPPQTGVTNYLDTDRHVGSFGFGVPVYRLGSWNFDGAITLQTAGQLQYLVPRTFHKDVDIDHDNPGYPKIGVSGWIWAVGFDVSWQFKYGD